MKKARIIISLIFLILYVVLFSGLITFSDLVLNLLTELQFIPAALKAVGGNIAATACLAIVLLLTLILGRFYCSTICPLGTIQDLFVYTGRKILKKGIFHYRRPNNIARYSIFSAAVGLFMLGNIFLLDLIEPFSNFGRIVASIFKPIAVLFFNIVSMILLKFHIYVSSSVPLHKIEGSVLILSLSFLAFLFLLSVFRGRSYCNIFCPAGALFSVFSRFSYFKLHIRESECTGCGICERVCKAQCLDAGNRRLDYSRCIHCYNCLDVCPRNAIRLGTAFQLRKEKKTDDARRKFLSFFIKVVVSSILLSFISNKAPGTFLPFQKIKRRYPVIPPGGGSISHFSENCTACDLCVTACPSHVIKPALMQYGITGIFQPVMDYSSSFCNYECNICLKLCPTGALREYTLEEKKLIQLGMVNLIKKNCIVYSQDEHCGICAEYCPTRAVYLVPYKEGLPAPETDEEVCIGCGACEYVCPARPEKAIYIEGNPVQRKAKKKLDRAIKSIKAQDRDFPF